MSEKTNVALTAEQIAKLIATEIKAYHQDGPNLRTKHLKLACEEFSEETINALWDDAEAKRPRSEPNPEKIEAARQIEGELQVSEKPSWVRIGQPRTIEAKALPSPSSKSTSASQAIKEAVAKPKLLVVAPEAKKQALVKFNPIKNPYGLNGFENARIALEQMELDCALDLFHQKPIIQGRYTWLGGEGFEDIDNVILKLRELILDEFGFDPKTGTFDAFRTRCVNNAFDPLLDYLDSLEWAQTSA